MNVNGQSVNLPSGSSSYAAIDTGTTLVGGPSEYIAQLFAQIPGSAAEQGNFEGYYTYRKAYPCRWYLFSSLSACDTSVTVSLSFGGKNWTISSADFRLTTLSNGKCLGAFFELATGASAPPWIIGDTFLVNYFILHSLPSLTTPFVFIPTRKMCTLYFDTTRSRLVLRSYPMLHWLRMELEGLLRHPRLVPSRPRCTQRREPVLGVGPPAVGNLGLCYHCRELQLLCSCCLH